jgi:hypothetical protein
MITRRAEQNEQTFDSIGFDVLFSGQKRNVDVGLETINKGTRFPLYQKGWLRTMRML